MMRLFFDCLLRRGLWPAKVVLADQSRTVEMAEIIKLTCKTFWSSMFMEIPPILLQHDQFVGWMSCFHTFINMPVPTVRHPFPHVAQAGFPRPPQT